MTLSNFHAMLVGASAMGLLIGLLAGNGLTVFLSAVAIVYNSFFMSHFNHEGKA